MEPTAIVTFIVIAGFIWGGFAVILITAIRREGRKVEPGPAAEE